MAGRDLQAYDFGSGGSVIDPNSVWFDHVRSLRSPKQPAQTTQQGGGNSLLKTLLSIGGGLAGGAIGTIIAPGVGTAIGAGLGSGLGTAAGRAANNQAVFNDGGAEEIALDTILGGVFSGAGKAAKMAARTGGEAVKGIGTAAVKEGAETVGRKGLADTLAGIRGVGEDLVGSATGIKYGAKSAGQDALSRQGAAELQNVIRGQGVKMTGPRTVQRGVETAIGKAGAQVGEAFDIIKQPISTVEVSNLRDAIFQRARKEVGVDASAPTLKRVNTMLSELGSNPTTQDILDASRKFTNNAGKFAQNNKTIPAQIHQIAKEESQKYLASFDKGAAKQAQKLYAQLNQAQDIMQGGVRGVEGRGLNLGGNVVGAGPLASIRNRAGNKILDYVDAATVGGDIRKATAGSMIKPLVARGAAREYLQGGFNGSPDAMQQPDMTAQADEPMAYAVGVNGIEPLTMGGDATDTATDPYADVRAQIQSAMLQDLQETGGANASKLATVLKAFEAPASAKTSVTEQNRKAKLDSALNVVNRLYDRYQMAGGAQSWGGYGSSLAGALKMNSEAAAYNDMRNGFLAQVSKALGESGVLTNQDVERVKALVPALEDTPDQASAKWEELMSILNGAQPGSDARFTTQEALY